MKITFKKLVSRTKNKGHSNYLNGHTIATWTEIVVIYIFKFSPLKVYLDSYYVKKLLIERQNCEFYFEDTDLFYQMVQGIWMGVGIALLLSHVVQ